MVEKCQWRPPSECWGFLSGCRQWHCWASVRCEFSAHPAQRSVPAGEAQVLTAYRWNWKGYWRKHCPWHFFTLNKKTGLCWMKVCLFDRNPSSNHDTDNMYSPTCTACSTRNPACRANSCDAWGLSSRWAEQTAFWEVFMDFPASNTPQTGSISCFIARESQAGFQVLEWLHLKAISKLSWQQSRSLLRTQNYISRV